MGQQFSTFYQKLHSLNSYSIAYPPESPVNSNKREEQVPSNQKYPSWSIKNLTDNNGWLDINAHLDLRLRELNYFTSFTNRDEETLKVGEHLEQLQKKEAFLKEFKYSEDFDRIDSQTIQNAPTFETDLERSISSHLFFCFFFSRIMAVTSFHHQYSRALWFDIFKKTYKRTFIIPFFMSLIGNTGHPINSQYFRETPQETRLYTNLAYGVDAFRNVNDIKYNFKYPEREEYFKELGEVHANLLEEPYLHALNVYKKKYGVVETEKYRYPHYIDEMRGGQNSKRQESPPLQSPKGRTERGQKK